MPVRFNTPSPENKFYRILIPEPGITYKAAIGYDEKRYRSTSMHWDVKLGRMVPCMHEECVYCAKFIPVRETTYVSACVWYGPKIGWVYEIVPIGESWRDVLRQDLRRFYYSFIRKGGKTSTIVWKQGDAKTADDVDFPGFELEPSLYRAWGMRRGMAGGSPGDSA